MGMSMRAALIDVSDATGGLLGVLTRGCPLETTSVPVGSAGREQEQCEAVREPGLEGATKAVYGTDPDDNTIEITWILPREEWGTWETDAPIKAAMDLDSELARRS